MITPSEVTTTEPPQKAQERKETLGKPQPQETSEGPTRAYLHSSIAEEPSSSSTSDPDCGTEKERLREEAEANEHWAHENCNHLDQRCHHGGRRLYGLTEAARTSTQTNCYKCQIVGASLSCCWGGCSRRYHYICAKEIGKNLQQGRV
ncbi:unnamed protein product [Boreogadus saida]